MSALDELMEWATSCRTWLVKFDLDADAAAAELAQLRARVAMLEVLDGESGLAAANRLMAACECGDIAQQAAPDIQTVRNEIISQARQLEEAHHAIAESSNALDGAGLGGCYASQACRAWLVANAPAETVTP